MSAENQPCAVEANLWLVRKICRRYSWAASGGALSMDDLIQAGAMGLMRALELYDSEQGSSLAGFAKLGIERAVQRCIAEHRRLVRVPVMEQRAAWRRGKPYKLDPVSLDAPAFAGDEGSQPGVDLLTDGADPTEELDATRRRRRIAAALRRIPERSRRVLIARFYGDASLAEVGKAMAISRERVRQLEVRALGQLRQTLGVL